MTNYRQPRSGPAYIITDGPYPDQNQEGDEIPVWYATVCDVNDTEISASTFHSFEDCYEYGQEYARRHNVEHVAEGMRA
jgi:hypothetical protein